MYRSDPEVIRACLDGNEAAWNELVERYARLVYSIALRYGMSPADADDVFQNVFTIVFRRLESLRDRKLLAAWLIRISHRECLHLRKRLLQPAEVDESTPDPSDLPLEEVEVWERRHLVRRALDQLEPRCRELLAALFLQSPSPSYGEISARFGIPKGSIGPWRARCFKKLEEILVAMGVDLGS